MIKKEFKNRRENLVENINADYVVIGGGLAGVCSSITAARKGLKVVLIQDRPVLGGNASSEVRLWALGATSHMGNNNRWSREGGVINEILLENLHRNKEGNPVIFDTVLIDKVTSEENITLLLNTAVYEVEKSVDNKIDAVIAFCSQNSTTYKVSAPYFCDASGDGIVAFMSGASFRMGAEKADEFDEGFAPDVSEYGDLLGHSIYLYSKDTGSPVNYKAPSYAIKDAGELPRIKNYKFNNHGCRLWWIEYGGRLNTIKESENIKFELWKVIYGLWDYIKNSGDYPEAENLTLEWVGTVPGKRESRRFNGDYMLSQKDIVEQRIHHDAVAHGGWAMDLHPADGVYSKFSSCSQWHSKGVYQIPYRCYYSKDIENLFLAGRIISASHVAFASSRIMLTCALSGQVTGMAAAVCKRNDFNVRDLADKDSVKELQFELSSIGHDVPSVYTNDDSNLITSADVQASSELSLSELRPSEKWFKLSNSIAQLLPLKQSIKYKFGFEVDAISDCNLDVEVRISGSDKHYTPEDTVYKERISLKNGVSQQSIQLDTALSEDKYAYICFMKNENVSIRLSEDRITGIVSVQNKINLAVSNYGRQDPPEGLGLQGFEFWTPERRPEGENIALSVSPALECFSSNNISSSTIRPEPFGNVNSWIASIDDQNPSLKMKWDKKISLNSIRLFFDADYDHSLECNLMEHPESEIPFIVPSYEVFDGDGKLIYSVTDNYQFLSNIEFDESVETESLEIRFKQRADNIPVAVYRIDVM